MNVEEVRTEVEKHIDNVIKQGVSANNADYLYKLVDIHKDLANEDYWKEKEKNMKYRMNDDSYKTYGRRMRDSHGRFMDGADYGRSYRGHDMIDEIDEHYANYSEGKEQYSRGNYSAKNDTMRSLEYMLQSVTDFIMMLKEDATSQEEIELIRKTARKISEM